MILISAAGSGGTNGLIENYQGSLIGITNDKYKIFTSNIEKNYLITSVTNEDEYIKMVNFLIRKYNIELFIPNSEIEVFMVTKNIDKINTKTFLPDHDDVKLCFDKWNLHQKMQSIGISSAKTFRICDKNDIEKAFDEIKSRPLWCRIKDGAGSKYTSKVFDIEDAKNYIEHCSKAYSLSMDDFLISEFLPGEDYAVMTIWKDGEVKFCKMAKRTRYDGEPGESPPTILESFYDIDIERFVIDSVKRLIKNPNGILNIDIKCYEDGKPAITEINAGRFYYNMQLFNYGRLNAFEAFLDLTKGKNPKIFSDDPKIVFIREQDNKPTIVLQREINE